MSGKGNAITIAEKEMVVKIKLYFDREVKAHFVLDRKRLVQALQAMDKICGDSPVYFEVTEKNDLLLRSIAPKTNQRVIALIAGVLGEWKEASEDTFLQRFKKRKKKRVLNRKKKLRRKK